MGSAIDASWVLIESPSAPPPKQTRELDWLIDELRETLTNLKHGLEDCYALLAPIDPGSTLVLSTPRNETVKGHVTRVGTRIIKGVCFAHSSSSSSCAKKTHGCEPRARADI
jgi:Rogdi leucine zipper containing protein